MRLYINSRLNGKAVQTLEEALKEMIKNLPERNNFVLSVNSHTYESIKKLSYSYTRGRWLYLNFKGKTFFVKKIKINKPRGFKVYKPKMHIEGSDKPMDYERAKKLTESALASSHGVLVKKSDFVVEKVWEKEK